MYLFVWEETFGLRFHLFFVVREEIVFVCCSGGSYFRLIRLFSLLFSFLIFKRKAGQNVICLVMNTN